MMSLIIFCHCIGKAINQPNISKMLRSKISGCEDGHCSGNTGLFKKNVNTVECAVLQAASWGSCAQILLPSQNYFVNLKINTPKRTASLLIVCTKVEHFIYKVEGRRLFYLLKTLSCDFPSLDFTL